MLVVPQEHPLALTRDMCVISSCLAQSHWECRAPTPGPSLDLPMPEEVSGYLPPLETVLKTTGYVSGLPPPTSKNVIGAFSLGSPHRIIQNSKMCAAQSLSCVRLLATTRLLCPWGFSRQEHWSGLSCPPPGDLPNPGIEPWS